MMCRSVWDELLLLRGMCVPGKDTDEI